MLLGSTAPPTQTEPILSISTPQISHNLKTFQNIKVYLVSSQMDGGQKRFQPKKLVQRGLPNIFFLFCRFLFSYFRPGALHKTCRWPIYFLSQNDDMFASVPLRRSLSRSLKRMIQRTLPIVHSRRRSWTTNAKIRVPIE
ncbi:hypothetical protein QBC38DRAFT_45529 [Podospora fimiseda]|uniref:Uncharacterized protein n=1 Tax=Podospora fimiseda TaxID=252190 RepID=A0AAN7BHM7_9PEZI|nr:hypothetical protein QBC38DRAFT_45529 [Podospora fimiseda]